MPKGEDDNDKEEDELKENCAISIKQGSLKEESNEDSCSLEY